MVDNMYKHCIYIYVHYWTGQVEMDSDGYYICSMQNFQNRIPLGKPKKMTFLADMSVKGGGAKH